MAQKLTCFFFVRLLLPIAFGSSLFGYTLLRNYKVTGNQRERYDKGSSQRTRGRALLLLAEKCPYSELF